MKQEILVCIAGKNQIAIDGLRYAIQKYGKRRVVVCPNSSDDGISTWQPSLIRYAREWDVRIVSMDELYAEPALCFISLEFDRIIVPEKFLSKKLFNIHFSRLPAYKGMYTSAWPILNGEPVSGVTLHRIDAGIDTGDIIDQLDIALSTDTTARDLYFACMDHGKILIERHFDAMVAGLVAARPQMAAGSSYYAKSSIQYGSLAVDFRNTAESVVRQSRAFSFREFQMPKIDGVPIARGVILAQRSTGKPGVVRAEGDALILSTIDFDVRFEVDTSWEFFDYLAQDDVNAVPRSADAALTVNVSNRQGWTPLMMAAYQGKQAVCSVLLNAGANPASSNRNGTTALMFAKEYAVKSGDFAVCRLLLDSGANAGQADFFGRTVLEYAYLREQHSAISFFKGLSDAS